MLHGLVASTPFDVAAVERTGVYVETLTFQRASADSVAAVRAADGGIEAAGGMVGRLIMTNHNTASPFKTISVNVGASGRVIATMEMSDKRVAVRGFADPFPTSNLQGLAFSALIGAQGRHSIAFGGFVDIANRVAALQRFETNAVAYQNKYSAVAVGQESFSVSLSE